MWGSKLAISSIALFMAALDNLVVTTALPVIRGPPALPDPPAVMALRATSVLRAIDGVAKVDIRLTAPRVAHTIIHLRDWHFVHRVDFVVDMQKEYGRELTPADIDRLYAEHLAQVEIVQHE